MGEKKAVAVRGAVVEIPAEIRAAVDRLNAERKEQGVQKYSVAVVVEAMATEGANHDWIQHLEAIDQRKKQKQTGRGRPRKQK